MIKNRFRLMYWDYSECVLDRYKSGDKKTVRRDGIEPFKPDLSVTHSL